jgi:hypothetical protein
MKNIVIKQKQLFLFFLVVVLALPIYAQNKIGDNPTVIQSGSLLELESISKGLLLPRIPLDDVTKWTLDGAAVNGMLIFADGTGAAEKGIYYWNSTQWVRVINFNELPALIANYTMTNSAVRDSITKVVNDAVKITAGTISSLPAIGDNFGTNITTAEFIQSAFFRSQAPTTTLSGGTTLELMLAGATLSESLNYSIGFQTATVSPVTGSITSTDSKSYPLGSFTGTTSNVQSVTLQRNVNTTFTLTATSGDGKTSTAATTFSWKPKAYYGCSTNVPTTTEILATLGGSGYFSSAKGSSQLSTTVPSDDYYHIFYAYPSSFGTLTSIKDNAGNQLINAFIVITLSVTNNSGYTQNYYVYYSNNTYSGSTLQNTYQ